jgi:hypothetical protein
MTLRLAPLALAAAALAPSAGAQTVVLQDGQPVGGVGNVTVINRLAVENGGAWLVEVATDAPAATNTIALRHDGAVLAREGHPVSAPAGAMLSSFNAISLNASGDAAWNLFLNGTSGTSDDSGVYVNTTLVIGESQFSTAPQFTVGTQYVGFLDARINGAGDVLVVASADDPVLPSGVDRALVIADLGPGATLLGETVVAKEGDAPAGLGGDTLLDFETDPQEYDFNDAGQVAYVAGVTTSAGGNAAILLDTTVVARIGAASPLVGRPWEFVLGRPLALNNGGALLFRANVGGSTADDERLWLRSAAGTITSVAAEGDPVTTADGTFLIQSFGTTAPLCLSDAGDTLWFADLDDPDTTHDAVLIRNGAVLVQEGRTTVGGVTIQSFQGTSDQYAMSPDGRWVLLECRLTGNVDAVVLIDTDDFGSFCDASDGALAACPCANPGTPSAGCDNAQSTGGVSLSLLAQTTSPNGATLQGSGFSTMGAPTAIVIRSNALDPSSPVVFGDGLRCVSAVSLVRLAATTAVSGTSVHAIGHGAMAGPGTFYYQLWYRNTPSTFCDPFAAFNLSNGARVGW